MFCSILWDPGTGHITYSIGVLTDRLNNNNHYHRRRHYVFNTRRSGRTVVLVGPPLVDIQDNWTSLLPVGFSLEASVQEAWVV